MEEWRQWTWPLLINYSSITPCVTWLWFWFLSPVLVSVSDLLLFINFLEDKAHRTEHRSLDMGWPCKVGGLFTFLHLDILLLWGNLMSLWIFWHPHYWHDISVDYYQPKPLNHFHTCSCYPTFTWSPLKFTVSAQLWDMTLPLVK